MSLSQEYRDTVTHLEDGNACEFSNIPLVRHSNGMVYWSRIEKNISRLGI